MPHHDLNYLELLWKEIADKAVSDLKVSALLIDGDYELVDVGDELVTLSFPQSICTFLQKLHEDILRNDQEEGILKTEPELMLVYQTWSVAPSSINYVIRTSLKWTSCMPTSSIIAASSSMFGVTTRNAEQPCLIIPAQHSTRRYFNNH